MVTLSPTYTYWFNQERQLNAQEGEKDAQLCEGLEIADKSTATAAKLPGLAADVYELKAAKLYAKAQRLRQPEVQPILQGLAKLHAGILQRLRCMNQLVFKRRLLPQGNPCRETIDDAVDKLHTQAMAMTWESNRLKEQLIPQGAIDAPTFLELYRANEKAIETCFQLNEISTIQQKQATLQAGDAIKALEDLDSGYSLLAAKLKANLTHNRYKQKQKAQLDTIEAKRNLVRAAESRDSTALLNSMPKSPERADRYHKLLHYYNDIFGHFNWYSDAIKDPEWPYTELPFKIF